MNKTPVSILQEMMVKKQIVPQYDLIHDGGGTHINTFIYRVQCDGLSATGQGRCKKDAKHEAAKAMIQAIATTRNYPQLPASPADSPVNTSKPTASLPSKTRSTDVPFLNAVGALQDLCFDNNLDEPEYNLISDVGPPHARIFTMQCVVATFKEEGVATTKKQAKQEASKKMLDKIQDLIADSKDINVLGSKYYSPDISQKELLANEIAMARYPTLSKLNTAKKNLGLKISNYHTAFKTRFDEETRTDLVEKLNSLISTNHEYISVENTESLCMNLQEILLPFNLEFTTILLNGVSDVYVIAAKITTCPDIVEILSGNLKDEVKFNVVSKLIATMLFSLE